MFLSFSFLEFFFNFVNLLLHVRVEVAKLRGAMDQLLVEVAKHEEKAGDQQVQNVGLCLCRPLKNKKRFWIVYCGI